MQIIQMGFSNDKLGIQFITAESVELAGFKVSNMKEIQKLTYVKI